jgi:hypothetical protein
MSKKRETLSFSGQIRKLIDESGQSRYAISDATGVDEAALSRFMSGKVGLTTKTLDTLGEYLGWRVVAETPRAGGVGTAGITSTTKARGRKGKVSK